jgi:hypothetical protein
VTGHGREQATVKALDMTWSLRFLDGFPVGPNIAEDAEGRALLTRFSRDRMHLDCDRRAWGDEEPGRVFVDYRLGISSDRSFRDGKLLQFETKHDFWIRHGILEFYDLGRPGRSTDLALAGEEIASAYSDGEGRLLSRKQTDIDGRTIQRSYFRGGALNVEYEVFGHGQRCRYMRCFDENGAELAPGGTGTLRERIGDGWRTGHLVDGWLDGEVLWTDHAGAVIERQRFAMGELIKDGV